MRAAVVLLAAACSAPASAQSPDPPLPAHNGWIAFSSDRGSEGTGRFGLHRLEPIGGDVTPLGLTGRYPAWSPDGNLIAFVDGRSRLVVAQGSGQVVEVLTNGIYPVRDPAWSPDGSRIVFSQSGRRRFRGDLVLAAADGSSIRRITRTNHDDVEPSWSPDGSLIVFASDRPVQLRDDYELNVVRPDGSGLRPLTANEFDDRSPSWSPDGARIAFVSGRTALIRNPELWTITPSGATESRVQPASAPESWGLHIWSDTNPSWSPDGRWLVYVTNERWGWDDIFIVEADTRRKFDLTPEAASYDLEPAWQPQCHVSGTSAGDVQHGSALDDLVCGFHGEDTLVGGPGRDRLFGGFGNDTVRARDGERDVVGCGAGRDVVKADRIDLVGVDCEGVRRR
jgi:dipeptidyl aminopeptidase/acylaminoacyl peptidase